MGRKRKSPVEIEFIGGGTEVPPQDGLPPFKRFIDIEGERRGQKILTRLFFVTPSVDEVADTVRLRQSMKSDVAVIGAKMPYMPNQNISPPVFEYLISKGFSEGIATDFVRLVINHLQGKHLGNSSLNEYDNSLRNFVDFLANQSEKPRALTDINKTIWFDYLTLCEASQNHKFRTRFNYVRAYFNSYPLIPYRGWLRGLTVKEKYRTKPSQEHTSEFAETKDYSDMVMYQLLSLLIYNFEQRIGYLKRYELLTEADLPKDWIYPGRKNICPPGMKSGSFEYDTTMLILSWLSDEEAGYQILIDHYIMHHKAGLLRRNRFGQLAGGIATRMNSFGRQEKYQGRDEKFQETMGRWHGYDYQNDTVRFYAFYLKKKTANERNSLINQIGWCLANLVMMQTGANKEVVLTIPSKAEDGRSILTRSDSVFVKNDGSDTEINLYGTKSRTGNSPKKVIPVIIEKRSPLYEMLVEYERYVKVGDGPFFEFDKHFIDSWSKAGIRKSFEKIYQVVDENGEQLSSIDSTRFRKVFASGQLLDRMKGIKDMNELAEMLRDDLNHRNLDTTISHYLMKTTVGRGVVDIAIATIVGERLDNLRCLSRIELSKPIPFKKKVFLCHCFDPHNPSHDVAIADECKHYDLCLGCEQSIITKMHLPYICLRITQYEAEREKDPDIWTATYEDRWCIAHDALNRYIVKDKNHGQRLVDEAWVAARKGCVSLPPIIASTRM